MCRHRLQIERHVKMTPNRMRHFATAVVSMVKHIVRRWGEDRVSALAAEIAFFAMLSVFPFLIAVAAALGSLDSVVGADAADRVRDQLIDRLDTILTDKASGAVDAARKTFERTQGNVLSVALLGSVWSLSRSMDAALNAVAIVYGRPRQRSWWRKRLRAGLVALGAVITVAITATLFVVGPFFGNGVAIARHFGFGEGFLTFWTWFRLPFAFAVFVGFAAVLFHVASDRPLPWRRNAPGAVATGVLWIGVSTGLQLYLRLAGNGPEIYAALGGALILLLWLYLLALSLIFGAELNRALTPVSGADLESRRDLT